MVVLDLRSGRYSALNPVGALVWSRVRDGASRHAVVEELHQQFDVPPARIDRDVESILSKLELDRLIIPVQRSVRHDRVPIVTTSTGESPLPKSTESWATSVQTLSGVEQEAGRTTMNRASLDVIWTMVAFMMLVYVDLMMKVFGFPCLYDFLNNRTPSSRPADATVLRRIIDAVDRAASAYPKRAWCLQRSAVCVWLLRRRGIPADLVLGVRTFPFEAHAWAELAGRVINDTTSYIKRLLVLDRI